MIRKTKNPRSPTFGSFDPFSGPATQIAEELELVDLMSFQAGADAALPQSTRQLEHELDRHLGRTQPSWEQLDPVGLYPRFFKPVFTLGIMLVALPVALLVMLPIALANWAVTRDRRLIFFAQERVGQYGRIFSIYKFRTMRPINGDDFASWGEGDQNRVTLFGRFLRSTHLDEVPQILNILRGDMDFIGPRPEMVAIHNWACREVPGFERRLTLRPGITGLAQITQGYAGQCPEAYAKKLAGDDRYRERLSFGLEISILVRTAIWMVCGRGWKWDKKSAD